MAAAGPPNPNGYPPKSAWLEDQQRHMQDCFDYFRTVGTGALGWDEQRRRRRIAKRAQPVRAAAAATVTPGFLDPASRADRRVLQRLRYQAQRNRDAFRPARRFRLGAQQQQFTTDSLNAPEVRARLFYCGLRFVKVLGWGGNGLATLWNLRETTWDPVDENLTTEYHNVVLKNHYGMNDAEDQMNIEKRFMEIMARAPHIQQRFNLSRIINKPNAFMPIAGGAPGAGPPPAVAAATALDTDPRFLWMKFARYKELDGWIRKVYGADSVFPRPVLWQIFKCLVDACVAMACPPRHQYPVPGAALPVDGPDLPETVPPGVVSSAPGYWNIVHFDLDPQNVFLLDTDDGEHQHVPRLQVSDFGYMTEPSDLQLHPPAYDDYEHLWSTRDSGKFEHFFPEQFTREWDNVNYEPYSEGFTTFPLNSSAGAAGAYSEKSNLYHVALVLRCCMTLCYPSVPPVAAYVDHGGWAAWSYGGDVEAAGARASFGDMLCDLVVRCLAHEPLRRPRLAHLHDVVTHAAAENPLTPADEQWVTDTIFGPGQAPPAVPMPGVRGLGAETRAAEDLGF